MASAFFEALLKVKTKRDCIAFALEALHDVVAYLDGECQHPFRDRETCVELGPPSDGWCPVCIATWTLKVCREYDK